MLLINAIQKLGDVFQNIKTSSKYLNFKKLKHVNNSFFGNSIFSCKTASSISRLDYFKKKSSLKDMSWDIFKYIALEHNAPKSGVIF